MIDNDREGRNIFRSILNTLMFTFYYNTLTSYIKLCNYVMLNSNEPIKDAHLQKLMLNGALVKKW